MSSEATGYSGKPVWQKLGLRSGLRLRVEDAPSDYRDLVGWSGAALDRVDAAAPFDLVHLFVTAAATLRQRLPALSADLPPSGVIWVSWPKKSAQRVSDVSEDTVREVALPLGLVDIKVCAIDATWSALKLVWRKQRRAART